MERLVDPLTTTDAKLWADEFMKVKARLGEQKFDHAMMLGWFANAIMQGYDEGRRRAKADAQATVEALQARVQELEGITKVICGHCCEPMEIPSKAVLQSQLTQRTAELEALQRERDTARRRVDELEAREVDVVLLRDDLDAERDRLARAIVWALGYTDFRAREQGEGAYWWRTELRLRAKLTGEQIDAILAALTPAGRRWTRGRQA